MMIFFFSSYSYAAEESILITKSPSMEDVLFDGKWSNYLEWKQSSHNLISHDDGNFIIHLRTAHYEDYIYVFIDPISDLTLDKKMDESIICFDAKNDKTKFFSNDDFCFSISLDSDHPKTFQGNNTSKSNSVMNEISNPNGLIAISSVSDENDRYSTLPHSSYEFKIPIQILNRSDNYGFYLSVFDSNSNEYYTWPNNSTQDSFQIPSPSKWGNLISPDKSLPEINYPLLILLLLFSTMILINFKLKKLNRLYQ
ncbi:DOMON domain-containing protein [Nitrosopumilus sp. S4]